MIDQRRRSMDRELASAIEASKAPAISRAAAILRLLGESEAPLGVNSIARDLGLPPSTCFNLLKALTAEKLVAFDTDTKRYYLAVGVLTLAGQWLRRNRFSELAQPRFDRIGQSFNVAVVGLHFVDLDHVIVAAFAEADSAINLRLNIGKRFAALSSAAGRCIAAFGTYTDAELEPRFNAMPWDHPPTFEEWKAQALAARKQGFAIDQGVFTSGLTAVAAPVCEASGTLRYLIVAFGLSRILQTNGLADLSEAIVSTARDLSARI